MAICPICSGASDGKRITFNGFDIYDLCIKCASYSICLINPNVDVSVKENAIRWAEREIQNNADKMYLANCIRSWKGCAEEHIAANKPDLFETQQPAVAEEVNNIESNEIDFDATVRGFSTYNGSEVIFEDNRNAFDSSILDVRKSDFFTADEPVVLAQPVSVPVEDISSFSEAAEYNTASHTPEATEEDLGSLDRTQVFVPGFAPASVPADEEETIEEVPVVFEDISSNSAFPIITEEAPAETAFAPVEEEAPAETAFAPIEEEAPAETVFAPIEEEIPAETAFAPIEEEAPAETAFAPIEEKAPAETAFAPIEEEAPAEMAFAPIEEETPAETAFAPIEEEAPAEEVIEADEETEAEEICEEASESFTEDEPDIKDYLREISLTLKSINERMERIEKEITELKK